MAYLKEVMNRIHLITYTQQITKATKMIAAAKLHKIQQVLVPLKAYTDQYNTILHRVLPRTDESPITHPLTEKKKLPSSHVLYVVVASERGLCGGFNKNVLKKAHQHILQLKQNQKATILVIGKKAHQFFKKTNLPIIDDYKDILAKDHPITLERGGALATYCREAFQNDAYSEVILIYTSFKSLSKQEVQIVPFLPFALAQDKDALQSIYGIYEPSKVLLIEKLIPEVLKNKIRSMLIESGASEHAARVITMNQATDNAELFLKKLRITYNRMRQSLITNALAEITSGAEALTEK